MTDKAADGDSSSSSDSEDNKKPSKSADDLKEEEKKFDEEDPDHDGNGPGPNAEEKPKAGAPKNKSVKFTPDTPNKVKAHSPVRRNIQSSRVMGMSEKDRLIYRQWAMCNRLRKLLKEDYPKRPPGIDINDWMLRKLFPVLREFLDCYKRAPARGENDVLFSKALFQRLMLMEEHERIRFFSCLVTGAEVSNLWAMYVLLHKFAKKHSLDDGTKQYL